MEWWGRNNRANLILWRIKHCGSLKKVPSCPSVLMLLEAPSPNRNSQDSFRNLIGKSLNLCLGNLILIYYQGSLGVIPISILTRGRRSQHQPQEKSVQTLPKKMITDDGLYRLAIFLGSAAMLLIILYHFLEVNRSMSLNLAANLSKPPHQKQIKLLPQRGELELTH